VRGRRGGGGRGGGRSAGFQLGAEFFSAVSIDVPPNIPRHRPATCPARIRPRRMATLICTGALPATSTSLINRKVIRTSDKYNQARQGRHQRAVAVLVNALERFRASRARRSPGAIDPRIAGNRSAIVRGRAVNREHGSPGLATRAALTSGQERPLARWRSPLVNARV
jgi:hypothetical protein